MSIISIMTGDLITAIANFMGIVATTLAAIFSGLNYFGEKRKEDLITIQMVAEDDKAIYTFPSKIRRKNLTRAEVMGMVGTVTIDGKRYDIAYLSTNKFYLELENAQINSHTKEINIIYTPDEAKCFKFIQK